MESLYTKYRPQTFADVVGQGHVVATLERAVLEGRTGHAYLFCGPRGTGKTTMARLLAKALLCEQGPGHLPDGSCEQCRLVAAGEHPDVYELDAASNTGVDNVREEIISRVDYAPVFGKRKVYIIDEVHMLTTQAFNALLKTLEEPPSHVVFVLCTTDPQKILETILSRVQRFDFHAISDDDVLQRLRYVCEQEGFVYEPRALDLVVRHAQGGMRDALTKLEQLATGGGGTITLEAAQELLGEVSASRLADVSMALAEREVPALFSAVAEFASAGRDLLQVTAELAGRLRDVYVVSAVGAKPGIVSAPNAELGRLAEEARAWGAPDRLSRALAVLAEASAEMRLATNQRLVLELAFTRLARPEGDVTLDALAERVAVLERQLAELGARAAEAPVVALGPKAPAVQEGSASHQPAPASEAAVESGPTHEDGSARPSVASAPQAMAPTPAPGPTAATEAPSDADDARAPKPAAPQPQPRPQESLQGQTVRNEGRPQQEQASQPASHTPVVERQSHQASVAQPQPTPAPTSVAPTSQAAAVTNPSDLQRRWKSVADDLLATAPARGSLLLSSSAVSDDGTALLVSLPKGSGFAVRMLDRADVRALIEPLVTRHFGHRRLVFAEGSDAQMGPAQASPAQGEARVAHGAPAPAPVPASSTPSEPEEPKPAPTPATSTQPPANVSPAQPVTSVPPQADYPLPWDAAAPSPSPIDAGAPDDDYVPYDDADYYGAYEEDAPPIDIPQGAPTEAPAPRPAPAPQTEAVPVPVPVPWRSAEPEVEPAPEPEPKPEPTPAIKPEPAPEPQKAASTPRKGRAAKNKEEADLMALLTEVFGEGVTLKDDDSASSDEG